MLRRTWIGLVVCMCTTAAILTPTEPALASHTEATHLVGVTEQVSPFNSFYGFEAGLSNTTGNNNAFFGQGAGRSNSVGGANAYFGSNAGRSSLSCCNAFFGSSAGVNTTAGSNNAFFGSGAGNANTSESFNTFIGNASNGTAGITNATALGNRAQVTQSDSLVLGSINGVNTATADTNVGIGTTAPARTIDVHRKGALTGRFKNAATSGDRTVLLDLENADAVQWRLGVGGPGNFFGLNDGQFYIQDPQHVALLIDPTNTFLGKSAGEKNDTNPATNNSFFGAEAGQDNTGSTNSFFGHLAGHNNTSGCCNTFFGYQAGNFNTTGFNNAFFGNFAGRLNTEGTANAFFGREAGISNTTEDANSFFGVLSNGAGGITNATALGHRAQVLQSDSLVLGSIDGLNGATSDVKVGIGTPTPSVPLHVRRDDGTAKVLVQEASATTLGRALFQLTNNGASRFRVENTANNAVWDFQSSGGGGSFVIDRVGGAPSLDFELRPTGELVLQNTVTATGFVTSSDRAKKTDITPADATKLIALLRQLDISTWRFKDQPQGTINLGPMAQDFHRLFGMGTDTTIDVRDLAALALVVAQVLDEEATAQVAEQWRINESLQDQIDELGRRSG